MSQSTTTCFDGPVTSRAVRTSTEDPLATWARSTWSAGDFLPIARSYARGAEMFITQLRLLPGESVLDVACGVGTIAIPASRAGARVKGIDIAPYMISQARLEARAAGCHIDFQVANAEALPFGDGVFDTTVTMFGAMFASRPQRTAAELVRVTRPGGRVVMANWTADGFAGQLLRAHAAMGQTPAGLPDPLEWGRVDEVRARFDYGVTSVSFALRSMELRFPFPPAAVTDLFATFYGPTVSALEALDADDGRRLRSELTRLLQRHNRATDGTTTVAAEYLDVQARVA